MVKPKPSTFRNAKKTVKYADDFSDDDVDNNDDDYDWADQWLTCWLYIILVASYVWCDMLSIQSCTWANKLVIQYNEENLIETDDCACIILTIHSYIN